MTTADLSQRVHDLLERAGIAYREVEHEPVHDYETAERVRVRHGLTGVESKSLFLTGKDGRRFMFLTVQGQRLDSKAIKRLVGTAVSVGSDEELTARTGCEPGCAVPFGHLAEIGLIVDDGIAAHPRFIFSPGPPERTIEIATADVEKILAISPNPIVRYVAEAREPI